MVVDNTWKEVTLTVGSNTVVQNTTLFTLLIKFESVMPVNNINAIYKGYRTHISDAIFSYANDRGKMWVKILEDIGVEVINITVT